MPYRHCAVLAFFVCTLICAPLAFAVDTDGDGVDDINDVCPNSKPGSIVDAVGRPYGDADEDCDVDLADFQVFVINMTGSIACSPSPETCNGIDDDCDELIDEDFDLLFEVNNCGSCGYTCPSAPNATPACNLGECDFDCAPGYADCDASAGNGCEVDWTSNPQHCGGCGVVCSAYPNAPATCQNATCVIQCDSNYMNCNGNFFDGCEVNILNDPNNCGSCSTVCTGGDVCVNGSCQAP